MTSNDPLDELLDARLREEMRDAVWKGRANRLSAEHVHWSDIDAIHHATRK